MQAIAAGSWVHQFAMAGLFEAGLLQRGFNVFARTSAGVGEVLCHQVLQSLLVEMVAMALPYRGFIGEQAASGQLLQDEVVCARNATRCVDVFNAHQPLATVGAGVQPTGQRSHQ